MYEILDNAVDEAQAGFASRIDVVLLADDSVSITDNGRGVCFVTDFSHGFMLVYLQMI